jgi:hypothetical protein
MLYLTNAVLRQSRQYFEIQGASGCEGTAMIARSEINGDVRLVVPEQIANPVPHCWVEVTTAGKVSLARALDQHERYVARIHSHPGEAFHSATDDRNPAITHEGAISIVAPFFGLGLRSGLTNCAVFILKSQRWIELPPGRARDEVVSIRD